MSTAPKKTKKKKLIVIFGPAGSGKTIFARTLASALPRCEVLDDFAPSVLPSRVRRAFRGRVLKSGRVLTSPADTVIVTSNNRDITKLKLPNLHTVIEMRSCKGPLLP